MRDAGTVSGYVNIAPVLLEVVAWDSEKRFLMRATYQGKSMRVHARHYATLSVIIIIIILDCLLLLDVIHIFVKNKNSFTTVWKRNNITFQWNTFLYVNKYYRLHYY